MLNVYHHINVENENTFEIPFVYEKKTDKDSFYMFEDTIFPDIGYDPRSCYDTIDSKCTYNLKLDECIDKCDKSNACGAGVFLENVVEDTTICLPFRTQTFPDANPIASLRSDHQLSEDYDFNSTTFIKKSKFSYPSSYSGYVSFDYPLYIVNSDTNKSLFTKQEGADIYFMDGKESPEIYMYPRYNIQNFPKYLYIFARFGNHFFLNLRNTTFVLQDDKNNNLNWQIKLQPNIDEIKLFKITNIKSPQKYFAKPLEFYEDFNITYDDDKYIVALDSENKLVFVQKENLNDSHKINFKCIPSVLYYCNDSKCVTLPDGENWNLSVSKDGKHNLLWKGKQVFIGNGCSLYCDYNKNIIVKFYRAYPWLFVSIFILLLFIILYKFVIKTEN